MNSRRLTSTIAAAAIVAGVGMASTHIAASAADDDCTPVSTAKSSTDGASYKASRWYTYHRTVTATTTQCGADFTTEIVYGPWIATPGTGDPDNVAFARAKADAAERARLEAQVRRLQHKLGR